MPKCDPTNAERQRRYRANRAAKLAAIRKGVTSQVVEKTEDVTDRNGVTSQAIEKPTDVTQPAPIYKQPFLPLDSFLSLQEKTAAREAGLNPDAPLTLPCVEYARNWSDWDEHRIAQEWERFRSYYVSRGRKAYSWWAMWQAWVQEAQRRDERQNSSPFAKDLANHQRTMAVLNEYNRRVENGEMRSSNGSAMRQSDNGAVRETNWVEHGSTGAGTDNIVHGAFGGGGQERDKYGYPKTQKVADSSAPRRVADGRNRAD